MYELVNFIESNCSKDEIPVGAFVIDSVGNVISKALNNRQLSRNILGHAEILAIQEAEKYIDDWRLNGYSMVVSLKPCDMCALVIKESRLDKVYYLLDKNEQVKYPDLYDSMAKVDELSELELKYNQLLTSFFANKR
ncbi:MAG: nucleoside deaminase [Clostridia bacterium]|nr:nucleoside deaminase [Clostridia bacterium]